MQLSSSQLLVIQQAHKIVEGSEEGASELNALLMEFCEDMENRSDEDLLRLIAILPVSECRGRLRREVSRRILSAAKMRAEYTEQ